MRGALTAAILVSLAGVSAATARAASITYTQSVPPSATGWSRELTVPQFDPVLGTLTSIVLTLQGHIEGVAGFENTDASATDVGLVFAAQVGISGSTLDASLTTSPSVSLQSWADAFDGAIDFGGNSGAIFADLVADDSVTVSLADSYSKLSQYIGTDVVTFTAQSSGHSYGSGAGNLFLNFQQTSSARVDVVYGYSVPEPGMIGLTAAAWLLGGRRPVKRASGSPFSTEPSAPIR